MLIGQNTFNHRFPLGFPASILSNIIVTDSCYYLTGTVADSVPPYWLGALFLKTDLEGNPLVVKTIMGQNKSWQIWNPEFSNLPDGSFAVAGHTFDSISRSVLIRYDQNGDTLFTNAFANLYLPPYDFIWARAFAPYPDGGFVFACEAQQTPIGIYQNVDIWVVKTDSLGEIEWNKKIGNNWWEKPYSLKIDSDANIIIGGHKANLNITASNYTYQTQLIKLNGIGNILWTYLSPTSLGLRYGAADMVLLEDGSLVVASGVGYEQERTSVNTIYFDKHIFKLNPMQEIEWEITFTETALTGTSFLTNLIGLSDNSGFVAAGTHGEEFDSQNAFSLRGWIGKVSTDGDSLWTRQYIGLDQLNNRHAIYDLKEAPDGGFLLCGESRNPLPVPGEIAQQAWLLKLDEHGCLVPGCHLNTATTEPEQEAFQLAIYPNPATDYLNFFLHAPDRTSALSFRILDAAGRLVQEIGALASGATYILPVSDWPRGAYVLQGLEAGKVLCAEKFIKQ